MKPPQGRESALGCQLLVMSFPVPDGSQHLLLERFVGVLLELPARVLVVTGGHSSIRANDSRLTIVSVRHRACVSSLARVVSYAWTQVRFFGHAVRLMHRVDALVLYMGAGFLPAIFVAKAARKPILVIATGSGGRSMSVLEGTRSFMTRVVRFLEAATYRLCDVIVVYSRLQCGDLGLKAGDGRIVVAREHYVDHQLFVSQSLPSSRPPVVLFLGRFSREKGVLELLRAVPLALQRCPEAIFRFVGGGELEATLREEAARLGVVGSVRIEASVAHAEVPGVLNAARFLVLPSYTEGLPNVVLEAMACGTPVLVMPVGSIAEFIRDGETGFLLPDNTPAAIASSFGEVWGRELDAVAAAAQRLVRNEFTMERATEMYREVLVRCGLLRARTE